MIFAKFKKENRVMIWLVIISLFFILLGFVMLDNDTKKVKPIPEPLTLEEVQWVEYVNEEYDFSLSYPKHWKIHVEDDDLSPKINIYPFQDDIILPFDHFAEATHFSIYPKGVPSEGLIGQNIDVSLPLNEKVKSAKEYILSNNDKWATMVSFEDTPSSWKPWGFIWSGVKVKNLEFSCKRGNQEVEVEVCNPFEGDTLLREGNVNSDLIEIERKIINSFKFIE